MSILTANKKALLLFLLFMIPSKGFMSQVFYQKKNLQDIIFEADFIITVKKSNPEKIIEKISIHSDEKKYPPYSRTILYYDKMEVLWEKEKTQETKGKIKVLHAKDDFYFSLHKEYYLQGLSVSFRENIYESKLDSKTQKFILFLKKNTQGNWEFVCQGSIESIEKKEEVLKLIHSLKSMK